MLNTTYYWNNQQNIPLSALLFNVENKTNHCFEIINANAQYIDFYYIKIYVFFIRVFGFQLFSDNYVTTNCHNFCYY